MALLEGEAEAPSRKAVEMALAGGPEGQTRINLFEGMQP